MIRNRQELQLQQQQKQQWQQQLKQLKQLFNKKHNRNNNDMKVKLHRATATKRPDKSQKCFNCTFFIYMYVCFNL